jgi:hypothetical protein
MADLTVDDLLAEIAPRETVARVLLRQELVAQHAELEKAMQEALQEDARENRDPVGPVIAAKVMALESEMDALRRPFTFRAVGQRKWADLLAQHPPTKEQRKIDIRLDNNPDTFPVCAIAASCIDPVLTEDQVRQFEERLDLSQWSLLWTACLEANMGTVSSPKSVVAGAIARANAELEKLPKGSVSLAASSLAES